MKPTSGPLMPIYWWTSTDSPHHSYSMALQKLLEDCADPVSLVTHQPRNKPVVRWGALYGL